MKLIENYFDYKSKYSKYILLIEVGTFIEVYGEDTGIINRLFGYKVKEYGDSKRCGFPINSLSKVEDSLIKNRINYIIITKNGSSTKKRFNPNNYDNYKNDINIDKRINKIVLKIQKSSTRYDINEVLCKIERLL